MEGGRETKAWTRREGRRRRRRARRCGGGGGMDVPVEEGEGVCLLLRLASSSTCIIDRLCSSVRPVYKYLLLLLLGKVRITLSKAISRFSQRLRYLSGVQAVAAFHTDQNRDESVAA